MKIHCFEEGIKDESFNSIKTTILADHSKFPNFASVMGLYSNFKCLQMSDVVPQACTVSALTQGHGGGGQGCDGSGRGRGHGGDSRSSGLVPQEEVNKVTNVKAKRYPTKVYNNFTPAQKAKHWQLMNSGKTPGSGPTKNSKSGSGAPASGLGLLVAEFKTTMSSAASAILNFTDATNKRTADKESDLTGDSGWGCPCGNNRDNPALARQDSGKKPRT